MGQASAYVTVPTSVLQALRDRVDELEELVGVRQRDEWALPLSAMQEKLVGLLRKSAVVNKERAYVAMYGARPECDQPVDFKIIDTMICNIRKKLAPYEIEISTKWGQGYYLSEESRTRLDAFVVGKQIGGGDGRAPIAGRGA